MKTSMIVAVMIHNFISKCEIQQSVEKKSALKDSKYSGLTLLKLHMIHGCLHTPHSRLVLLQGFL